jgi:hypothetical protein
MYTVSEEWLGRISSRSRVGGRVKHVNVLIHFSAGDGVDMRTESKRRETMTISVRSRNLFHKTIALEYSKVTHPCL